MEDLTGKQLGPYRVIGPLGEGGMASVYKGYQPGVDRSVALKILPRHFTQDLEFITRFQREAKVLARLQHPHILPVFDYGEADGYTYIVMPYLESGTLGKLLEGATLPYDQIERVLSQVGDALDYAHAQGIIHRDVKPSNILIDASQNCLLTDFGIARVVEGTDKLTATGAVLGTPAYMAPEQCKGDPLDGRADLYALGIILYEMATGRVPFIAETPVAVIIEHLYSPLPMPRSINPDLPETVERVILKALAKEPADRYQSGAELAAAFRAAVAGSAGTQQAHTVAGPTAPTRRVLSSRVPAALPRRAVFLVLLMLVLGLGGLFVAYQAGAFTAKEQAAVLAPVQTDFPLPADAWNVSKAAKSERITFNTKLSNKELLQFYRQKFEEQGWVERIYSTYMDEASLRLLFDDAANGKTVDVSVMDMGVNTAEDVRFVAIDYIMY